MTRSRVLAAVPAAMLFVLALALRLHQQHDALLYPDGYQYLLMARGIGEHLQPTTVLGPGGDVFTPNPDAAAKPLFPIVVATVHLVGISWLEAARLVTAVAGAWVVTALALLVTRLSGSTTAGVAAGLVVLASPSLALWSGFSGPDPLAQALVLTSALAFADGRSRLGGLLVGLAIAARPEAAAVAIAAGIVALRSATARRQLRRAAPLAIVGAALPVAVIQSPVTLPDSRFLALVPAFAAVAVIVTLLPDRALGYAVLGGLVLAGLVVATRAGAAEVWRTDWPLLVLAALGCIVLLFDKHRRATAMAALGAVLLLGAVYVLKNPTLARYFSLLLPAAALLAGAAAASLPRRTRPVALGAIAGAAAIGFAHPVPGSRDHEMFPVLAKEVSRHLQANALVTAAPDAYGFWLPTHPVRTMRLGAQGAVLLDAAQRVFEPELTADGSVLARIEADIAFAGPDLEIDAGPAVLVAGEVVADNAVHSGAASSDAAAARHRSGGGASALPATRSGGCAPEESGALLLRNTSSRHAIGLGCLGSYRPSSPPPGNAIAVTSPNASSRTGWAKTAPFDSSADTVDWRSSHMR
jgi:hypothetical protein